MLLTNIQEMLHSNLGQDTSCPGRGMFVGFLSPFMEVPKQYIIMS